LLEVREGRVLPEEHCGTRGHRGALDAELDAALRVAADRGHTYDGHATVCHDEHMALLAVCAQRFDLFDVELDHEAREVPPVLPHEER
jgi:hypothetical protein